MSGHVAEYGAAPALRLVPSSRPLPDTLPRPDHPLVGREADVAAIRRALLSGARLVTLTGTGGVGKTRVAIEAARRLWPELTGTMIYVAARTVTNVDQLAPLIAAAAGWPVSDETSALDIIARGLAEQPTVLVIDNGEQIARLDGFVGRLLDACPHLIVLLTSRRALGATYEQVIVVRPLPREEAAMLLAEAARRHDPAFELNAGNLAAVDELCRRLDRLPLALELAAARLRLITPGEMLALLERRFDVLRGAPGDADRERSGLWSTIDWSYRQLVDDDRRRFRALSVFPDTFTMAGAAAVCGCDPVDILDTLGTLVDHHLVERAGRESGEARFVMLETLREFAAAQLDRSMERDRVADAHAEWCATVLRQIAPEFTTPNEADAFAALDAEVAGLRAALAWSLQRENSATALAIMDEGWRFWRGRGRSREGLTTLEQALAIAARTGVAPELLARALYAAGELADDCSELTRAVEMFEQAAAIQAELGNWAARAEAQNGQAQVLRELGDLDHAAQLHEAAAAVFQQLGMLRPHASSLNGLGGIATRRGNHAEAAGHFQHAYDIVERLGDRRSQGLLSGNIGIAKFQAGDFGGAIDAQSRALAIAEELGDRQTALIALLNRAEVQIRAGRFDDASAGLAGAEELAQQIGFAYAAVIVPHHRGLIAEGRGQLGAAARFHVDSLRQALAAGRPLDGLECVERLALLAAEVGASDVARRCFGVARSARAVSGSAPTEGLERWVDEIGADEAPPDVPWADAVVALMPDLERFAASHAHARRTAAVNGDDALRQFGLSAREAEVARLVIAGRTDREIAAELYIGVRTVATHVSAVLRKVGVASRREVGPRLAELTGDPRHEPG